MEPESDETVVAPPAIAAASPPPPPVPGPRQVITADTVECDDPTGFDYSRLVTQFGITPIDTDLLARFEAVSAVPLHRFLRRGIFFAHRDLHRILDAVEAGRPVYLYTGRGPSAGALHVGHLVPFLFTAYLQKALKCPVVIQLTDDEKFLKKGLSLEEVDAMVRSTAADIIACGFDPASTLIFSNFSFMHRMYPRVCEINRLLTCSAVSATFGVVPSDCVGRMAFPAVQIAPSFASTFGDILDKPVAAPVTAGAGAGSGPVVTASPVDGEPESTSTVTSAKTKTKTKKKKKKKKGSGAKRRAKDSPLCLVLMGVDQDPYFRLARDVAPRLGEEKAAVIHGKFLPALSGLAGKMSTTVGPAAGVADKPIFVDSNRKQIRKSIMSAVSGGRKTLEEHRRLGANVSVDVPLKYLQFFLEDDKVLEQVTADYAAGKLTSGEVKTLTVDAVLATVEAHQTARRAVTPEVVEAFMTPRCLF